MRHPSDTWLDILTRITADAPVDLDRTVFASEAVTMAPVLARAHPADCAPAAVLWGRDVPGRAALGVRVTEPLADCALVALHLASAALERGVTPIILTSLPSSGFERFGFRVERIAGATHAEQRLCEDELVRFWDMAIVIDAADVAALR